MCLVIKRKSHKQTAKRDIVVYKIVEEVIFNKRLRTPYQLTTIKIGEKYDSIISIYDDENGSDKYIEEGLHSISTISNAIDAANDISNPRYYQHIVRCVIPKGSEYYVGIFKGHKSYASSSIIYQEIIKTIKYI